MTIAGTFVGLIVGGKYRIEGPLGQGGMGAVFRAVHLGTSRTVALKVIAPRLASEPEFLQRFQREAHACGQLRHPNIVDVTDFGVVDQPEGKLAYLVMEYLDGCPLTEALKDEGRLPLAWCVDVLGQVSSAVEEAHRHGILHRDLKPDNIWLEPNQRGGYTVKVLDFGLAKATAPPDPPGFQRRQSGAALSVGGSASSERTADTDSPTLLRPARSHDAQSTGDGAGPALADETSETLVRELTPTQAAAVSEADEGATRAGSVVGTPAYMSPEQIQGLTLTTRSDVYSLGVIAYLMVTGRPPFQGATDDVLKSHVLDAPRPVHELRPDLPLDAAKLIMSALEKDPKARPAGAVAFAEMFAARFETPTAFLHGALQVFISHLGTWLRLSVLCMLPLLIFSLAISFAALLHASGQVSLPWLARSGAHTTVILIFWATALAGFLAFGVVVVPPAMQVLAAPLRPVEIGFLLRRFAGRFRQWGRTMLPVFGGFATFLLWLSLCSLALRTFEPSFRPYLMTLDRPTRVAFGLSLSLLLISVPLAAVHIGMRRFGGAKGLQFLSTVTLVEGLTARAALQRAAELYDRAGKALRRAQAIVFAPLGILGFLTAYGLDVSERFIGPGVGVAWVAPLVAILFVVAVPFPLLVGELIYIRARRAAGDPLDHILAEFERLVLPESHWRLTQRDRLRAQIDLTT